MPGWQAWVRALTQVADGGGVGVAPRGQATVHVWIRPLAQGHHRGAASGHEAHAGALVVLQLHRPLAHE